MKEASIALNVYFDGQFYVGLFELTQNNQLAVCKFIFGTEPNDCEILDLILSKYFDLQFSPTVADNRKPIDCKNPKTRQRKIKRLVKTVNIGTKAQQAIKKQMEERKTERNLQRKICKKQRFEQRFLERQQNKKEKHKGH